MMYEMDLTQTRAFHCFIDLEKLASVIDMRENHSEGDQFLIVGLLTCQVLTVADATGSEVQTQHFHDRFQGGRSVSGVHT